jgi:superfamily I DNA/RNA helicase
MPLLLLLLLLLLQLLLEGSGMVESLQQVTDPDKVNKAQGRLTSLKTLIKLAGLPNFQGDAEEMYDLLQQDENDDGWPVEWPSSGNSSSTVESSSDGGSSSDGSSSDSVQQLRNFMDYCALQGENDRETTEQRGPRVHFLTMHASKGKEFPCVALPSFYEGILPSDRENTPAALEQERNTAYVAVTRAKDKVLITWPKAVMGKFGYDYTRTSRFLNDAIRMAAADQLPGIELVE